MVTLDDYLGSLTETQVYELERLYDQFGATSRMEDGPATEQLLTSIERQAQVLDSAELVAACRTKLIVAAYERRDIAEIVRLFVPTMDLLAQRGDEISDHFRLGLESLVMVLLGPLVEEASRPVIEDFLDQVEKGAKSGRGSAATAALARAYWYAHTGEREEFERSYDSWVIGRSDWWRPELPHTIRLTAGLLGSFDPAEALDHVVRRAPTMVGDPTDHLSVAFMIAGWRSILGDPATAWEHVRGVIAARETPDLASLVDEVHVEYLLRAFEAAPDQPTDPAIPAPSDVVAAAIDEINLATMEAEEAAAVARHLLLRGDIAEGQRWRDLATARAAQRDHRNGTGHHTALLATRWFHDL